MKNLILIISFILAATQSAKADWRGGGNDWRPTPPPIPVDNRDARGGISGDIEMRLRNLEDVISRMDQRIRSLESLTGIVAPYPGGPQNPHPPAPYPAPSSSYTCMLVDAAYAKTFVGKGSTKLQAEASVRQECGKSVNAAYCNSSVKCSDGTVDPYARGYFCVVTDAAYSKTFTGQGADAIEAEAKAKQSCQQSVNAAYCGNVSARCEAQR